MFDCKQCGNCCRNLGKSEIYSDLDRGDGVCRYLSGNLCSIYEERPLKCRVDECYKQFFKEWLDLDMYYRLNKEVCEILRKQEG